MNSRRKQTPSPSSHQLRQLLPDVALKMETRVLLTEARDLGLVVEEDRLKRSSRIWVELKGNYLMSLEPVDMGPDRYREWMTFLPPCKCPNEHYEYSLRVAVEIHFKNRAGLWSYESFTIEGGDLMMVIDFALLAYSKMTGRKPKVFRHRKALP